MLSLLMFYLVFLCLVFALQRKLIYFPEVYSLEQEQEQAEQLNLKLWPSIDNYLGLISKSAKTNYKGTIIVFHGNAGSAKNRIYFLQALEMLDYRVILAEYPGYGARAGIPTESSMIESGLETVKQALNDYGSPVFLWGESIGSGVVSGILQTEPLPIHGIVLVTPFDSLANVAQHHYWYFLAKWLIRDKFDNIKNLQNYQGNIAILLAEQDEIIPHRLSMNLYESLNSRKRIWTFGQADHNSLPLAPELPWWREAMQFVTG